MKAERSFRVTQVIPFLKTLKNTAYFPLQQLAIVGDSDFHLCVYGLFVALELKAPGEKPRPLQKYKLDWVKRTHGVALAADPTNWSEVKTLLRMLDKGASLGHDEIQRSI